MLVGESEGREQYFSSHPDISKSGKRGLRVSHTKMGLPVQSPSLHDTFDISERDTRTLSGILRMSSW